MRRRFPLMAVAASLVLAGGVAQALAEFGIEGMHVVSTPASEVRATISPDGQRIVWGSTDRKGGAGGWDLWQATLKQGRWQDAKPVPFNSKANDFDPAFSANGRWLYFFSNRDGGLGGDDIYRVAVRADGFGAVENLGPGVNGKGDEWAPAPSLDGKSLLFASDGFGGAGRHDLFVARWDGSAFVDRKPVPGVNTRNDEFDATWLGNGQAIVFTRSANAKDKPMRLLVAQCEGKRYGEATPVPLSFNTEDAWTLGPMLDWHKPGELLVTGKARAPSAGQLDIYRMKAPVATGKPGCV